MDKQQINRILIETESGYDLMADKFSQTRKHFWRDLEFIKDYTKDGDKVLDFGCGNGRLLELLNGLDIEYFGVDVSRKLIDAAKSKYQGSKVSFQKISPTTKFDQSHSNSSNISNIIKNGNKKSNLLNLVGDKQFPDNYFNTIYGIAVLHHMPDSDYRAGLTKELYGALKPGGHIIITVWNLRQKRYIKNIINNWLDKLTGKSNLDWNDCYIAFTNNSGEVFQRYHHAFTARELEKGFKRAGFQVKMCRAIKGRNIVLVGKK